MPALWQGTDAVNVTNLNSKNVTTGDQDQIIDGIKTFTDFPKREPPAMGNNWPTQDDEFATKSYVDNAASGSGLPLDIQGWSFDGIFSATDFNTVAWTSGTIRLSQGNTYSISAGNTGNMAAATYIYFDSNVSTTELQTTTSTANATGAGKILIAVANLNADNTKQAEFQVFGGRGGNQNIVTTDILAADAVTANELAVNSVYAAAIQAGIISVSHLTFTPLYSTGGVNEPIATINASSEGLNITSDRISISGSTTFSTNYDPTDKYDLTGNDADDINDGTNYSTMLKAWKHSSDTTKIDGGVIYTGTVVLSALAFVPLSSTSGTNDIIATINASGEVLNISASKIAISGSTTFSSGWASASNAESDINALNTANGPAEANADVTGNNTANDTNNVNGLAASSVSGWANSSDTTKIDGGQVYVGSQITVGTGDNVGVVSGSDATYRIWAGSATAASAPFRVTQTGAVTMTNASIQTSTGSAKIEISSDSFKSYYGSSIQLSIENGFLTKYDSSGNTVASIGHRKTMLSDFGGAFFCEASGGGFEGEYSYGDLRIGTGIGTGSQVLYTYLSYNEFWLNQLQVLDSGLNLTNIGTVNCGTITSSGNFFGGGYGDFVSYVDAAAGFKVNGTEICDSSKNLTNIGTVNCGAITSSGNFTSSARYMYHDYEHDTSYPLFEFRRAKSGGANLSTGSILGWIGFEGMLSGSYTGLGQIYGYCNNVSTKASDIYMGIHNGTSYDLDAWIFQSDGDAVATAGTWTTFTGSHIYQSKRNDLEKNSAVILLDDGTIDYTTKINDKRFAGVVVSIKPIELQSGDVKSRMAWRHKDKPEFENYKDSMGNEIKPGNTVYVVAAVGDCLTGRNDGVRIIGEVENGDNLCTSYIPGCLQKQPEMEALTVTELIAQVEQKMLGKAMVARQTIRNKSGVEESIIYATF